MGKCVTYEAVLVGDVVGELELVERDDLLHPLLARRRTVRMDVHPLGHLGVRLARHHPSAVFNRIVSHFTTGSEIEMKNTLPVVKLVPVVVRSDNVEEQNVL